MTFGMNYSSAITKRFWRSHGFLLYQNTNMTSPGHIKSCQHGQALLLSKHEEMDLSNNKQLQTSKRERSYYIPYIFLSALIIAVARDIMFSDGLCPILLKKLSPDLLKLSWTIRCQKIYIIILFRIQTLALKD